MGKYDDIRTDIQVGEPEHPDHHNKLGAAVKDLDTRLDTSNSRITALEDADPVVSPGSTSIRDRLTAAPIGSRISSRAKVTLGATAQLLRAWEPRSRNGVIRNIGANPVSIGYGVDTRDDFTAPGSYPNVIQPGQEWVEQSETRPVWAKSDSGSIIDGLYYIG